MWHQKPKEHWNSDIYISKSTESMKKHDNSVRNKKMAWVCNIGISICQWTLHNDEIKKNFEETEMCFSQRILGILLAEQLSNYYL